MAETFVNPLPGVPSVESPFFQKLFSDVDPETMRIAQDLRENGYAIFDFPDPDFNTVAESIKSDLSGTFNWDHWRDYGYEHGEGMRVQDAWQANENVRRLAANQKVTDLLSKLYGRQAHPFQTLNFPVGTQQHYHTDSIHFSSMPERFMCGVWIALEDISEEAGPLVYYPGSHKWPIYTNEHLGVCSAESDERFNQSVYEPVWRALVDAHGVKPKTFTAKKGQALIWTANLLHGGLKQTNSSLTRWSQVNHYYFDGCAYYTPMFSDPAFGVIDFRTPPNVNTGKRFKNQYAGHDIPEDFVQFTKSRPRKDAGAPLPPDFDPKLYLEANNDLRKANVDPIAHYRTYGHKEGRPLRPLKD
ncbi:phytanoyl-CoA dioxygenase [Burkholderia ubonensis]|uniref:phytanoyl-CoA dioxygenase family protein n=1 Tax=Burkholderia ubonensis TaxID=101571 RepID=UPI000BA75FD6|nr:phytanoyl-CoA dioxygenase family protein [Burkholderia ubonensis]PAK10383.1 phytanoyl-CoA dioxygenase [Burkholderia ubonensis]RQP93952.1 phytanoyl-CoA dioxygenase [Burkholderia ubonensis]